MLYRIFFMQRNLYIDYQVYARVFSLSPSLCPICTYVCQSVYLPVCLSVCLLVLMVNLDRQIIYSHTCKQSYCFGESMFPVLCLMYPRKEFAKRRGLRRPLSLHCITTRNMHFFRSLCLLCLAMQIKVCNDAIAISSCNET